MHISLAIVDICINEAFKSGTAVSHLHAIKWTGVSELSIACVLGPVVNLCLRSINSTELPEDG